MRWMTIPKKGLGGDPAGGVGPQQSLRGLLERKMRLLPLVLFALAMPPVFGQFELPVQLVGFPVIIIAVRIANFIKKLTYALNPNTYRSRPRRAPGLAPPIDVAEVEKQLVAEMGEKVCIYEQICEHYALQSLQPDVDAILDWEQIFRKFATSPRDDAEFYLLSIFLGDIVGSPHLCRQLAKRGRSCKGRIPLTSAYAPINLDNRVQTARAAPQQSQSLSWQYYYAPNAPQISAINPR